jgi:hypothetical protein
MAYLVTCKRSVLVSAIVLSVSQPGSALSSHIRKLAVSESPVQNVRSGPANVGDGLFARGGDPLSVLQWTLGMVHSLRGARLRHAEVVTARPDHRPRATSMSWATSFADLRERGASSSARMHKSQPIGLGACPETRARCSTSGYPSWRSGARNFREHETGHGDCTPCHFRRTPFSDTPPRGGSPGGRVVNPPAAGPARRARG